MSSAAHMRIDRNVFNTGKTRGGKSVLSNEMHALFPGFSLFWNSEEEENIVGHRADSIPDILDIIGNHGRNVKIDYRPRSTLPKDREKEFNQLQPFLFEVSEAWNRNHPMQCVVDECQDIGKQGGENGGLYTLAKKGLKREIKCVMASQDPATVDKTLIRQCDYTIWCGGFNNFYEPYFDAYKLPVERIKGNKQGDAVVFEGAEPLYDYRADAKFA